jgi:hypothetical protein
MRSDAFRRRDRESVRFRSLDYRAAQLHQLFARFLNRCADTRANLYLALVQLGLHVAQQRQIGFHDLVDPALQLPRVRDR